MTVIKTTTKDLAVKLQISQPYAAGFIQGMIALGQAKEAGTGPKPVKGMASKIYEINLPE